MHLIQWTVNSDGFLIFLRSDNNGCQEGQSGQANQAWILPEFHQMNRFCANNSRILTVESNQLEILAAVRALKPSADDQRANLYKLAQAGEYRNLRNFERPRSAGDKVHTW
ncbi:hypothetical protein FCIRC_5871 [Fusarium circinatum]|uniref:Uncharacterized protein n=1 Tax=Fusarium circinatum TaxID=48490 RepID=A0A8H5X1T0_FUSCI|nr:hypothetical protein FCIRC_5871 [Fusarium circinatum]